MVVFGEKLKVACYNAGVALRSPLCTVWCVPKVELNVECTVATTSLSCVLHKFVFSV